MTTPEMAHESPQAHITRIRRDKFSLDGDGLTLSQNPLATDLQNSVNHLSEGLYSKDIHFVLELIQNAEDNEYPPGQQPELTFHLLVEDPTGTPAANGALLVTNNEKGLRSIDVDALCAVGQSTKTKRQGYIGEKGIGFKSVFRVSKCPHIFSAGYRFRFDREPDREAGLGYIVPYWVDSIPQETAIQEKATHILLPLDTVQWEQVANQLRAIAPETILFLSRLEGLSLVMPGTPPLHLIADKQKRPRVYLLNGDDLATYWIHQIEVTRPPDLDEEKRLDIIVRDVSVAFPLMVAQEPAYSVFAFLPTEVQSGYSFLVNADFILSTSRETILVDRPWNQWLRDQIPRCFVEGFCDLLSEVEYRQQAYRFIPLQDEVRDSFFLEPVKAIRRQLRELPVIWTDAGAEPVLPSDARLAPFSFRQLLEHDRPLPRQLTLTPLVRSELERYGKQLRAIGVKSLQPNEVRSCLEDKEWLIDRSPEWFVKLYGFLQQDDWGASPLSEKKTRSLVGLPIIPTTDRQLATIGEITVYLPEPSVDVLVREHSVRLDGLGAVAFLDADLYTLLAAQPELLDWVKREFAQSWSSEGYCRNLVKALSDNAAHIPVIQLVEATKIVRDLAGRIKSIDATKLCDRLPLRLTDEEFGVISNWSRDHFASPANLEPDTGWQVVFSSLTDRQGMRIISDCYLEGCTDPEERQRWVGFFAAIGVTNNPIPKQTWTLDRYWRNHADCWRFGFPGDMPDDLRQQVSKLAYSTRQYTVTDTRVPHWLAHLDLDEETVPTRLWRARVMMRWLKRAWERGVIQPAQLAWFYSSPKQKDINSHFQFALQTAPWFPSTKGLRRPVEVFLDRPEVREIFGDTVPYATDPIEPHVAEWLGLRMSATLQDVLGYLTALADQPPQNVDHKLVERIYTLLLDRWRDSASDAGEAQKSFFTDKAMIRVDRPTPRWVLANDAIWLDRSDVFGDDFGYLERSFPFRLKEFFVDYLSIKEDAGAELYARAWLKRQQVENPDPKQVEATLERVFPVMRQVIENPYLGSNWWDEFSAQAQVWTQDDRFLTPSEVFVPDDGALRKIMETEGVPFVWRPRKDGFSDYQALYEVLGVRSLAQSITCDLRIDVQTNNMLEGEQYYLTHVAKLGICLYLWNQAREDYARLREDGTLATLLAAQEARVDRLELVYTLDYFEVVDNRAVAYFARDARKLFLSNAADPEERDVEVSALLARLLSKGRTNRPFNDFISGVVGKSEKYLEYLSRKNDWRLPPEEREWIERAITGQIDLASTSAAESVGAVVSPTLPMETVDGGSYDIQQEAKSVQPGEVEPAVSPVDAWTTEEPETEPGMPDQGKGLDESGRLDGEGSQPQARDRASTFPAALGERIERSDGDATGRSATYDRASAERHSETPPDRESQERHLVYTEPDDTVKHRAHAMDREKQDAIEKAGIKAVEAHEWARGRKPVVLKDYHPGWDIDSFDQPNLPDAQPDRRIEVKSKEGAWDEWGIALTPKQYESAVRYPETYYLYVVEYALDDERRQIHVFHNPAARVTEFRFRQNWRAYADESYPQENSTR